jgi:hypothetical protein
LFFPGFRFISFLPGLRLDAREIIVAHNSQVFTVPKHSLIVYTYDPGIYLRVYVNGSSFSLYCPLAADSMFVQAPIVFSCAFLLLYPPPFVTRIITDDEAANSSDSSRNICRVTRAYRKDWLCSTTGINYLEPDKNRRRSEAGRKVEWAGSLVICLFCVCLCVCLCVSLCVRACAYAFACVCVCVGGGGEVHFDQTCLTHGNSCLCGLVSVFCQLQA